MCSWGKFSSCSPQQTVLISFPILQVAAVLIYNGQRNYAVLIPASLHCLMRVFASLTTPRFFISIGKKNRCIYYLWLLWRYLCYRFKCSIFIYKARRTNWALDRGLEMLISSQEAHMCALGGRAHALHKPHTPHKPHTQPNHHSIFYFLYLGSYQHHTFSLADIFVHILMHCSNPIFFHWRKCTTRSKAPGDLGRPGSPTSKVNGVTNLPGQ